MGTCSVQGISICVPKYARDYDVADIKPQFLTDGQLRFHHLTMSWLRDSFSPVLESIAARPISLLLPFQAVQPLLPLPRNRPSKSLARQQHCINEALHSAITRIARLATQYRQIISSAHNGEVRAARMRAFADVQTRRVEMSDASSGDHGLRVHGEYAYGGLTGQSRKG